MKRFAFFIILAVLSATALSFFYFRKPTPTVSVVQAPSEPAEIEVFDEKIFLQVLHENEGIEMSLRDYLIGVVGAEMPQSFPQEALKAQAIAARTFTLRQADRRKHANADICTRSDCCQSWQAEQSEQSANAVEQTDGLVITYDDQLIEATYFSCCGNRTEAAAAVWGSDVPYLQSVESIGEEAAPRYTDCVSFDATYFAETLKANYPSIALSASPETWFGKISYTKGGGIDSAVIGGVTISGMELRKLFSLRSTDITFSAHDGQINITTYGFGHRVGMSQYGAKAMAEKNRTFLEILTHYYQNVQIQRLYLSA